MKKSVNNSHLNNSRVSIGQRSAGPGLMKRPNYEANMAPKDKERLCLHKQYLKKTAGA